MESTRSVISLGEIFISKEVNYKKIFNCSELVKRKRRGRDPIARMSENNKFENNTTL